MTVLAQRLQVLGSVVITVADVVDLVSRAPAESAVDDVPASVPVALQDERPYA
ncbi:hypothetical protein [Streptomyces sp. NPDC001450]